MANDEKSQDATQVASGDAGPTDDPAKPIRISTTDVDSAAAFWQRHAPKEFRGLMTAKAATTAEEPADQDE